MFSLKTAFATLLLIVASASVLFGQTATGEVNGTVRTRTVLPCRAQWLS